MCKRVKNETVQFSCTVVLNRRRRLIIRFQEIIQNKCHIFLLVRMMAGGRFLFTAIVVSIICSGNDAYPANDFFFNDQQLSIAGRLRSVVDKKFKSFNEETILNDMPIDEGSGDSGDAEPSDGDIGSGIASGDGEDLSTTTKSNKNDKGSGDGEPDDEDNGSGFSTVDLSTTTELQTNDRISTISSSSRWPDEEIVSTFKSGSSGDNLLSTTTKSHTNDKGSGNGEPDDEDNNGSGFSSSSGDDLSTTTELQTNDKISTISSSSRWPDEEIVSELTSGSSDGNDFSVTTTEPHTVTREVSIIDQTGKTDEEETTELSPTTLPTTRQPPMELVSIEVCGKRYYCPKGSQGPCRPNEILMVENESNNSTEAPPSYCSALSNYPWRGCLSKVSQETDAPSARCSLISTDNPCSGLPNNYRYDPVNKMCRPTSISNGDWLVYECGDDQLYMGLNRQTGSCRCINEFHLIYTVDNKCYHPFTHGPCNKGMWLEPSSRQSVNCRPSPCPENQIDGRHFYWKGHFHGPAGCYRTNTRGPCPENSTFVVTDYVLGHVRCRRNL